MLEYYNIAYCPIKYFKDFIDEYGLEHLQDVCNCSTNAPVFNDKDGKLIGHVNKAKYVYNIKLYDYCIIFDYTTLYMFKAKGYEVKKVGFIFFLTIIE